MVGRCCAALSTRRRNRGLRACIETSLGRAGHSDAHRGACPTRKKLPESARTLDDKSQGVRASFCRMSLAAAQRKAMREMCARAAAGPESKLSRPLHSPAWQSLQTVLNSTIVAIDGGSCAPAVGGNASRDSTAMPSAMAQVCSSRGHNRLRTRSASHNILMLYPTDEFGAAGRRQLPAHVADEPPQNWFFVAREIESHYEPAKTNSPVSAQCHTPCVGRSSGWRTDRRPFPPNHRGSVTGFVNASATPFRI